MKISEIFKRKGYELYFVTPEQALTEAVALMMHHHIGSLAVMEEETLVSIITERDVMRAVHQDGERIGDKTVREVMAPRLVCCHAEDSIDTAMELMFNNATGQRIRHLPVMDGGRVAGIISIGDIVQALLTETRFENKLLRNYIRNWPESD